jgi:rare lipoprotein A
MPAPGLALLVVVAGCTFFRPEVPEFDQVGIASFYGHEFHGRRTASGLLYDETRHTAAHLTLPFGTRVKVTDLDTRKSVVVTVNDRGPFVMGRVIDLSYQAARELGAVGRGLVWVGVEVLREHAVAATDTSGASADRGRP